MIVSIHHNIQLEEDQSQLIIEELSKEFDKPENKAHGLTFVRGGKINPDSHVISDSRAGEVYRTTDVFNTVAKQSIKKPDIVKPPKSDLPRPKGKKQIDSFMEELKKVQERRERIRTPNNQRTDKNESNDSTNIWIGNLNESITYDILRKELEKYGPIMSLKIIEPKTDSSDPSKKCKQCAFALYFLREDAVKAIKSMDGKEFFGSILDVSWAKKSQAPPNSHILHNNIRVTIPESLETTKLIDNVCEIILKYGQVGEMMLMEKRDPRLLFLIPGNPGNIYYRWRLFSLLQGDSFTTWRQEPFQMFVNGPYWIPPPHPASLVKEFELIPENVREKGKPLASGNKQLLADQLKSLTISKSQIRKVMGFSIDHSESAPDIVKIISAHMIQKEIQAHELVPVLYLINDILHNGLVVGAQNVHLFRSGFEYTLKDIFLNLHEKHKLVEGRISKQNIKDSVMRVLKSWELLCIYPNDFINDLDSFFLNGKLTHPEPIDNTTPCIEEELEYDPDIDGVPIEIEDIDFEESIAI